MKKSNYALKYGLLPAIFLGFFVVVYAFSDISFFRPASALAQATQEEAAEEEEAEARRPIAKPIEIKPEQLKTTDGVLLGATYYPGNRGNKTVPLILIHGWDGDRNDFATLAPYLQQQGHAVLVADLRGHGQSTTREIGTDVTQKVDREKDPAKLFAEMLAYDLPKLKAFLRERNNDGSLNINKLGLVGVDSGAILAAAFAANDWNPLVRRPGKAEAQTGDVKAIVLISPPKSKFRMKTLDFVTGKGANPNWNRNLSALIVSGTGSSQVDAPDRLEKQMVVAIKKAGGTDVAVTYDASGKELKSDKPDKKVYAVTFKSRLQGAKLIALEGEAEQQTVALFIEKRLKTPFYRWNERK